MSAAELFARGESNRTEQVVDAVEDPSPSRVGPLGTCTAPAQLGAGGATHGEPCPPAPLSREDRGTPGRVSAAAETLPSHLLAVPAAAREGSALSFQMRRPLRPRRAWCDPCGKMRDHIGPACAMTWWHR